MRDLKKLIKLYEPREVVIDTMGLGISVADEIIRPHWDEQGNYLEPYGFFNYPEYEKIQPQDAPKILYSLKASATLNSEMYGNAYSRINSGLIDFLIKDQEARKKLLGLKRGQKMSTSQRAAALMPYEMTTKLFEEMGKNECPLAA